MDASPDTVRFTNDLEVPTGAMQTVFGSVLPRATVECVDKLRLLQIDRVEFALLNVILLLYSGVNTIS